MINFEGLPTAVLLTAHNAAAAVLGTNPTKKFPDRATAEKRTRFALSQIPDIAKRPAPFNAAPYGVAEAPPAPAKAAALPRPAKAAKPDKPPRPPKAPKPEKVPQPVGADLGGLHWGQRPGSKREALIKAFLAKRNKFVSLAALIKATYGDSADLDEMKGPIMMVMKGMNKMITDNKLSVEIVKQKNGKEVAYGLIDKASGKVH
jgi:hypothetical protein